MSEHEQGLCESCRELKPVAFTDNLGREFCGQCSATLTAPRSPRAIEYLLATIPFQVGDRVEARTGGMLFDGVGVIDKVSTRLVNEDGEWEFGTPVYPSFHVVIEEKAYDEAPDSLWYMETQLKKVDA